VTAYACAITAVGLASAAVVAVIAAVSTGRRTATAEVTPVPAAPSADAHLPCHTTACAHLSRPHDRTTAGLTCRHCGTVTIPEAPRA
jgi:hypothetical protein